MRKTLAILPVKLIVGLIAKDEAAFLLAKKSLKAKYGQIDFESQSISFDYTDYYTLEFGGDLKRLFLGFEKLIDASALPKIKIFTNKLEARFGKQGRRTVNIDPGYLTQAKLVLASTKNFSHRIYLGRGIFAELTLEFRDKFFHPLAWTYPDYKTKDYLDIFLNLRQLYTRQIQCRDQR